MASSNTESLEALSTATHKNEKETNIKGQHQITNQSELVHASGDIEVEETRDDDEEKKGKKKSLTKMMRVTICELEAALKESHELLAERDKEIAQLKKSVDHYKQQTVKEVASKTKLAQSLDESHRQALELENALQQWQLSLREYQQRSDHLEAVLLEERSQSVEQEKHFGELYTKKCKEVEQLTSQLIEARQKMPKSKGKEISGTIPNVDDAQLSFLKQAVYHLLTDSHAEEHLRAIVSILNFTPQERKTVYAKVQEKKGRSSYGGRSTAIVLT